jgi:hypothetical protein
VPLIDHFSDAPSYLYNLLDQLLISRHGFLGELYCKLINILLLKISAYFRNHGSGRPS